MAETIPDSLNSMSSSPKIKYSVFEFKIAAFRLFATPLLCNSSTLTPSANVGTTVLSGF
jgi:hypothetical protein